MEMENLRALVQGYKLTTHQKRLAAEEFEELLKGLRLFVESGENILHAIETEKVFMAEEYEELKKLIAIWKEN